MPVKRNYSSIPVKIADGARLLPDLPLGSIGPANFDEKVNFVSAIAEIFKRSGWDYPAPTEDWIAEMLYAFGPGVEAIRGVRRPNGTYAIVGCGGGFIKVFNYDADAWQTIGSGYGQKGDTNFRFWTIEDIAGYAVFNNSRDLPAKWQVGDAAVTPMYEIREAGYASIGHIVEYVDGVLMCADVLEINDDDFSAIMNGPTPYATIVDGPTTTRISFRRIWSNIGNPGDFAVSVDGSITMGTSNLTIAWPMASFSVGDEIEIVGAGASGGNLQTFIALIVGNQWLLGTNALTTVVNAVVARPTDINSIAGYDDIEDDGSAIILQIPLKTQLMVFKASGNIWQSYYTGSLDEPFAKDRVTKKAGVAPRFPRSVVNIVNDNNEEYLLFAGAQHFYRYDLGSQAPHQERNFQGAEETLFFSRVKNAGRYDVWAADNTCTDEMIVAYPWAGYEDYEYSYYGASRAIALKYAKDCESVSEISGFQFTCAATVQKPLGGFTCNEQESWFLMGAGDGFITLYGETNFEVLTFRRYGEVFEATLGGGLFAPSKASDSGTYLRRFGLDCSNPEASAGTEVSIYSARMPNSTPVLLETRLMTNPEYPGSIGLSYRKPYYKYRLSSSADQEFRIQGFLWTVSVADTQAVDRIA